MNMKKKFAFYILLQYTKAMADFLLLLCSVFNLKFKHDIINFHVNFHRIKHFLYGFNFCLSKYYS